MSQLWGLAAVITGLVSYVPYLWGMHRGRVRPHAFTWFLWGLLTAIAFAAQLSDGAGPGSWITGATAMVSLAVSVGAWRQSRLSNVLPADWYFFLAALAAIPLWLLTKTPLYSVMVVTVIDALAYVPTFRKSWQRPEQESVVTFTLGSIKFLLGIAALPEQTLISSLYPWSLVATNTAFVAMTLYRRYRLCQMAKATVQTR
jgi:hypothetical protein